MVREINAVDDYVREYGLKHGVAFEEYTPGEDGVTLEVSDYDVTDDILEDIFAMAKKRGLDVYVEKIRVFVSIPEKEGEEDETEPVTEERG